MRGKLHSYNFAQLLTEANKLKEAGVKELLVISQDTSAYGVDKKYEHVIWKDKTFQTKFYDLCKALSNLGIWVRLHYVYPYPHVDDIIPLMHKDGLLPYLDVPLQHASAKILKAMKRPANQENTLKRIQKWREICPEITIRSTFIVGFPGETEEDFEELIAFIKEAKLDRVGCFQYSPVEGAPANALENPIPEDIKQSRFERFMETQAEISTEKLKAKRGQVIDVLIDNVHAETVIARSIADAPEIDGLVYLPFNQKVKVGEKHPVKVHGSDTYDLFADWMDE
jgi:ribosomal protein S12 methylthiotransferase